MKELYDPQEVIKTTTNEIARWVARIDRINLATNENHTVMLGGHAGDGIVEWYAAKTALAGGDWQHCDYFEKSIIYEMKSGINFRYVMLAALKEHDADPTTGSDTEAADAIQQAAYEEGLKRAGIFETSADKRLRLTVPLGAIAALCFKRGDIAETIDRRLYDRNDEIQLAVDAIKRATPIRTFSFMAKPIGKKKEEEFTMTVYSRAPHLKDPDAIRRFGFDPDSQQNLWWQELQNDLARIDEASGSL